MKKTSGFMYFLSHVFGRVKREGRVTFYVCFCPLFKVVTNEFRKDYFILGIRVHRKQRFTQMLESAVGQIRQELAQPHPQLSLLHHDWMHFQRNFTSPSFWLTKDIWLGLMENKIMLQYLCRGRSKKERAFLLFDCLSDRNAEAIDAYSLFLYMQEHHIPAKYVLRQDNRRASELQDNPDVIFVQDDSDFLSNHNDLIIDARCILSSFELAFRHILKKLPFVDHIFLEHGVFFFKECVANIYGPATFDKDLVLSRRTLEMYLSNNLWPKEDMILHGMPRWDLLSRKAHEGKNIFIFFTWRRTFMEKPEYGQVYFGKILSLLSNPDFKRIVREKNLTVNLAMHHGVSHFDVPIPSFDESVRIIDMDDISSHIGSTDLMITDHSSICFDFMYLDIPVIFYRFDVDHPDLEEVEARDFRIIRNKDSLIYNCVYEERDAVALVEHYAENDFVLEAENQSKNESFFWEKSDIRKHICEDLERMYPNTPHPSCE